MGGWVKPLQYGLLLYLLPAVQLPAANNADPFARHGPVDNRRFYCTRILGRQFKTSIYVVFTGANPHGYASLRQRFSLLQFADGISCPLESGKCFSRTCA